MSFTGTLGYFSFSGFLSPYLRGTGVSVVAVGLFFSLHRVRARREHRRRPASQPARPR